MLWATRAKFRVKAFGLRLCSSSRQARPPFGLLSPVCCSQRPSQLSGSVKKLFPGFLLQVKATLLIHTNPRAG